MIKIGLLCILYVFTLKVSYTQEIDTANYVYYEHQDFYIAFDKEKCYYNCDAEYDTNFTLGSSSFSFPYGFSFEDIVVLPKNNLFITTSFSADLYIGTRGTETEGPYPYEWYLTRDLDFFGKDSITRDSIYNNTERFLTSQFPSFNSLIYNYRYNLNNIIIEPTDLNNDKYKGFKKWFRNISQSDKDEELNYYIDGFWFDIVYLKENKKVIYRVYFPYIYAEC